MKRLDFLLVDDDQNDCAMFGRAIDKTGLNIGLQTITNGKGAIDYLDGRGVYADRSRYPVPGVLVLDLDIRLTGGFDFLSWRRASASFASLPVYIFSDLAYQGEIETSLAMGANVFITKPFKYEDWGAVVRRIWNLEMERSERMKPAFAVGGGCADPQAPAF